MTKNEKLLFLQSLTALGVKFTVPLPTPDGFSDRPISIEDILMLENDKDSIFAKLHGITLSQYLAWRSAEYHVQCAALTKKGRRCRQSLPGGVIIDPKKWLEMQGDYCAVHSGESAQIA